MVISGKLIQILKLPYRAFAKVTRTVLNKVRLSSSKRHIRKLINKKCDGGRIKVAFLVQMPELWNKIESVYDRMNEDDRFETLLIIVPAFDFVNDKISAYGDELDFFSNVAGKNKMILAYENSCWKDLSVLGIDYLFYQRPYERYLPVKYRTQHTSKFAKVCYVPYATPDLRKSVMYPDDFFRNIYLGFMDSDHLAKEKNARFHYENHRCFVDVGYPIFETCLKSLRSESNSQVVLWAPRWSYDPIIGGSHFFEYNDYLTNRNWAGKKCIIRVHPLLWENFEKEGRLTPEESQLIRSNWEQHGIEIDYNKSIMDTYAQTDVLVVDRSSILPLFFLTGKPIIYCPIETDYSELYLTILPGLYIAENETELENLLRSLLNGDDPLKETRREIIEKSLSYNLNATENILAAIAEDASGKPNNL